ncbi:hypothetical protein TNCV_3148681 [Trichonephila clavipes]|nr:hypothetical protein TNCV_3148681 [Trichonephila clavipes]
MFQKISVFSNCFTESLGEFVAAGDDNVCTAPIMADKGILESVQSSKNVIDSDFKDENEINNAAPVRMSSETRSIVKTGVTSRILNESGPALCHRGAECHFVVYRSMLVEPVVSILGGSVLAVDDVVVVAQLYPNDTDLVISQAKISLLGMNKIRETPVGLDCPILLSEEFDTVHDDNKYTAPIIADKDISEFFQISKNIIDADSDDENEMNNAIPLPTSSEMRNVMKNIRSYLDAQLNGEMKQNGRYRTIC